MLFLLVLFLLGKEEQMRLELGRRGQMLFLLGKKGQMRLELERGE
jgi:hypothetical protein